MISLCSIYLTLGFLSIYVHSSNLGNYLFVYLFIYAIFLSAFHPLLSLLHLDSCMWVFIYLMTPTNP